MPAHCAATPLHHYSYKAIEKRDGRCRIIEIPKPRLWALQRKVLSGLLDRIPAHGSVPGFRRGRNIVTFAVPHVGKAVVNLCAFRLDLRLASLARSIRATYTRYADDLAFSGDENVARMVERLSVRVAAIAIEEGFSVNLRKRLVMLRGARQHPAGVW